MRNPANREWLVEMRQYADERREEALARADADPEWVAQVTAAREAAYAAGLRERRAPPAPRARAVAQGPPYGPDGALQMAVTEEAGGATTTSIRRRDPQLCFEGSRVPDDSDTGSRMTVTVD